MSFFTVSQLQRVHRPSMGEFIINAGMCHRENDKTMTQTLSWILTFCIDIFVICHEYMFMLLQLNVKV